jgi:hypothetical protein
MNANLVFLLIVFVSLQLCESRVFNCTDKEIMTDYKLHHPEGDFSTAYGKQSSCQTLRAKDDNQHLKVCCYFKVKFKNKRLDRTFTQEGCYRFDMTEFVDFDYDYKKYIDAMKANISAANTKWDIDVKKINLDCHGNFLRFVGLAMLILLL